VCWEKCPGRRIPADRTIVKGKLVIGDNRGKPAPEAVPSGAGSPAGEPVN
jgi:hypothetical protein